MVQLPGGKLPSPPAGASGSMPSFRAMAAANVVKAAAAEPVELKKPSGAPIQFGIPANVFH